MKFGRRVKTAPLLSMMSKSNSKYFMIEINLNGYSTCEYTLISVDHIDLFVGCPMKAILCTEKKDDS